MKRGTKWALGLGIGGAALGAAWLAVAWWLPSDEELAARLAAEIGERLGARVTIGSAHWALLPRPVVVVNDFRTQQENPIVIGQLTAHPGMRSLLDRKFVFGRVTIRDAVFPRESVRAFRGKLAAPDPGSRAALDHFEFRNVTWIYYSGVRVIYDGDIDFDTDWRPRHAELRRPGADTPFTLTVKREGGADRWQARIHAGGGTMHGDVALESGADGAMRLSGTLAPRDVEVESLLRTFNRRSVVSGKGSGRTVLSAEGGTAAELARSLHTRTTFSIRPATLVRFDLDKAIRTFGKERAGQTPLEELTGQLDTQNTDEGMRAVYTGLKARSGEYSATGEVTVYRRWIEASGILYASDGRAKVPFTVSGPVAKPKTSMQPAAVAGAVVSRAGASIADALRRIFKNSDE